MGSNPEAGARHHRRAVKRNLLFHLYPIRGPVWRWHVEQLLRYQGAWNGKRTVVLAFGVGTEDEAEVVNAFKPLGAKILIKRNQCHLAETAHFVEALARHESYDRDEATFYAHGKGVTRSDPQGIIRTWCDAMYRLNLGRIHVIDRHLETKKAIGAFRLVYDRPDIPWQYSGTFWWMRHDALFAGDWRDIPKCRNAVERHPGRRVALEDSLNLTEDNVKEHMLYNGWVTEERIRAWEEELR